MSRVEKSVLYMKVTDALRAPSSSNIAELSKTYNIAEFPNLLLLATKLSTNEIVSWVIKLYLNKNRDINEIDPDTGNTALHVAVADNRVPVVRLLMDIDSLDDTIRNKQGLTALNLAANPQMETTLSSLEKKFADKIAIRLKEAFRSRDLSELNLIYSNPRVPQLLNINGADPDTGRTVLHDSAQANDVSLVKFILAHGGDPMIKDRKTQSIAQNMTTNSEIQILLNNSAKSKAILDQTSKRAESAPVGAPAMEGYLKKWTNFTSGYKLRYFVLKDSKLSYYKKPEETTRAHLERGSIVLRKATVHLDSSEKNRFEIQDQHRNKFHLKATHPSETNRWVWVLKNAITYSRDEDKRETKPKQTGFQRLSTDSRRTQVGSVGQSRGATEGDAPKSASNSQTSALPSSANQKSLTVDPSQHNANPANLKPSANALSPSNESVRSQVSSSTGHRRLVSSAGSQSGNGWLVNDLKAKDDDEDVSDDEYEDEDIALTGPQISAESIITRLSAIKDLMTILVFQVQDEVMRDAITTVQGSIDVLSSDIVMLQRQAQAHLRSVKSQLEKSDKNQLVWASNYRDLEIQYEKLESKAHHLRKQVGTEDSDNEDEFFDTFDSTDAVKSSDGKKAGVVGAVTGAVAGLGIGSASKGDSQTGEAPSQNVESGPVLTSENDKASQSVSPISESEENPHNSGESQQVGGSGTDEAKSSGNNGSTALQSEASKRLAEENSFVGYEDGPRARLALDADNRPKLSLWGILKNLIGKDMTKMTLPVTFNECTSLLQRSAEDMEYTELLDKAAHAANDPGLRMVYIAAFAGSSYSSTINRVAKPFNPLLGETYEYARPDKGYRLFSEQVSHHPPIGALMAESKNWDFYGESNVESKFYGRSFDINPLGLWYVNLRPDSGAEVEEELYSFRKLTSSVVGIMVGNPVVDNYGDMKITNHTTGINATISYKARGWRGSSAYKLQGKILDKDGNELWTIAGQWNDKMWGKKTGSDEKVLLWEAHERHKTPFNLTDFAVTLNDLNDRLKEWLPPTDTRLRPDQRAMEEGRYDDASEDKNIVEEKQRARRREREANGIEYKPQWFEVEKHPVTGLDYYKPVNSYWKQRAEKQLKDQPEIF